MERLRVNGKEYVVLKLLGKGKGGYSYLALDGERKVVVKQIHHEPCDYYQFGDKLAAERIVKEYIQGPTVYELVERNALPAQCLEQVGDMCALLYAANTNIDYFPTNFVLQDGTLYYIDYECNDYMDEWNFENWGVKYWARTPEFLRYREEHP